MRLKYVNSKHCDIFSKLSSGNMVAFWCYQWRGDENNVLSQFKKALKCIIAHVNLLPKSEYIN